MDPTPERPPPNPARHARAVFVGAALIAAGVITGTEAARSAITLLAGSIATSAMIHYAFARRARARQLLASVRERGPGRVVSRRDPGRAVFELPAEGGEPWLANAWVMALSAVGAVLMARAMRGGEGLVFGLVAALFVGVGLRLRSAASDRLRIEIGLDDWAVESVEAGRPGRRAGSGSLLPELTPEALLLWSSEGRVAVLRGEIEAEERAWLADELARLVRAPHSAGGELGDGVEQREAEQDRQGEQRQNAK